MSELNSVKWQHRTDDFRDPRSIADFQWKIEKFSTLPQQVDIFYESPHFSFFERSWCLRFFPNGENRHSSEGWFGLYLTMSSGLSCTIDFVFGIQKVDGTKEFLRGMSNITFSETSAKGLGKFLEKDKLMGSESEHLPSDSLTIWIWMKYKTSFYSFYTPTGTIQTARPSKKDCKPRGFPMSSDAAEELFRDKEDYDASTSVKSEILNDYKLPSTEIPKLFTGDMAEEVKGVVEKMNDLYEKSFKYETPEEKTFGDRS